VVTGKIPGTYSTGGWVGDSASLDGFEEEEISYPYRDSNPEPPKL
jgi:hypothetical protein